MIANYGFTDAAGEWYLTIDTDKCNGCAACTKVCPASILEVGEDEVDIFREEPVAFVKADARKRINYTCASCKPGFHGTTPPCIGSCQAGAISHSDGWMKLRMA